MADQMLNTMQDHSIDTGFSGINFSERYFVGVLRNAIQWWSANPEAWRGILGNVEQAELARYTAFFDQRPPRVRLGYARANDPMPAINVILESESASADFVGDLGGIGALSEFSVETGGAINTNIRKQTISVHVHADHPEIALYLYHMVHSSILSSAHFFAQKDLFNLSFTHGSEVMPQEVYLPESIYSRVLTYTFEGVSRGIIPLPSPPPELYLFVEGVRINETIVGGVTPT